MTRSPRPIDQIVKSAVSLLILNWKSFVARLWVSAVLLLVIDVGSAYVVEGWLYWVLSAASIVVYVIFAVITHRLYLLGEREAASTTLLTWGKRETYFLFCLLGIGIGFVVVMGLLALLSIAVSFPYLWLIALLFVLYVVARLSLVFPAAAVDQGLTFADSWGLTKNHQFLVLAIVIGVPIIFAVASALLSFVPNSLLLNLVIGLVLGVIGIGCLSLTYREIAVEESSS